MALNIKNLKEKVARILSAWSEGAASVLFMGINRTDLETLSNQAETLENEIAELNAQKKIKEDQLTDVYAQLNNMVVDVKSGVVGDKNFGDDSALYGAMGFVRKSERKSGLTRRTKLDKK